MRFEDLQHHLEISIGESQKGTPSVVFLDTDDQPFVHKLFTSIVDDSRAPFPEAAFLYVRGDEIDLNSPYAPFLQIIGRRLNGMSREEVQTLFETVGVYPPHRALLEKFGETGRAVRNEEIISEDVTYEQSRFRREILDLLLELHRPGVVFLISRGERLPSSTIEFIGDLENLYEGRKVQFVFAMNISGIRARLSSGTSLERFAGEINPAYSVYEINPSSLSYEPKSPDYSSEDDMMGKLENLTAFLCLEETVGAGTALLRFQEDRNGDVPPELLRSLSYALFLQKDFDKGLIYANMLINKSRLLEDPVWQARGFRLASMIYRYKGDLNNSLRLSRHGLIHAEKSGDPTETVLSRFALLLGNDTSAMAHTQPEEYERLYEQVIAELGEQGFTQHLAFIYSNTIYLVYLFRRKGEKIALETSGKGIVLAHDSQSELRLASVYQARGFLYQIIGRKDRAFRNNGKAEAILQRIGNGEEKARLYNGIGYLHFYYEEYEKARKYYFDALALLERSNDYEEICTTLVNIAFAYFICFKYDESIHYLEQTLKIINFLNIIDLPHHPRYYIYSILGVSYIKKNSLNKALEMLNKASRLTHVQHPYEYHRIIQAEMERLRGNWKKADQYFEEALESVYEIESETKKILLFCFREYGLMLKERGENRRASEVFSRALALAEGDETNIMYKTVIEATRDGQDSLPFPDLPFIPYDASAVIRFAKLDETLNNLHKTIMDFHFLNMLQKIIFHHRDGESMEYRTGELIYRSFPCSLCVLALFRETRPPGAKADPELLVIKYTSEELSPEQLDYICGEIIAPLDFSEQVSRQPAGETPVGRFYSTVVLPLAYQEKIAGFILMVADSKERVLTGEDIRTLSISSNQISTAVELKRMHRNLTEAATIDSLTEAYNRREFLNRMDSERNRLLRYGRKEEGRSFTLFFMDLDNFKFYNDIFGHVAGDLLLRYFAGIIRRHIRNVDLFGRYGGDEFMVMLPETGAEESRVIAERIISTLGDQSALREVIGKCIDGNIEIPLEKKLGCSIGIYEFSAESELTVDQILHKGDEAMYEAKRRGKNNYFIG